MSTVLNFPLLERLEGFFMGARLGLLPHLSRLTFGNHHNAFLVGHDDVSRPNRHPAA